MRISITNEVKLADHIKGFQRRVQAALNDEAKSLELQLGWTMKRLARNVGFK